MSTHKRRQPVKPNSIGKAQRRFKKFAKGFRHYAKEYAPLALGLGVLALCLVYGKVEGADWPGWDDWR
jgi:hypothetical protein